MAKYQSTYEKIKAEKEKAGKYHVLPEATNIKIMQELNEGAGRFAEQKMKKVQSEQELAYVVLNF